jgi:hypothetical protein
MGGATVTAKVGGCNAPEAVRASAKSSREDPQQRRALHHRHGGQFGVEWLAQHGRGTKSGVAATASRPHGPAVARFRCECGGSSVAAAMFQVPEPKTRGQKRNFEEVQEHHDQWWLRGVAEADDEPSETHTGDSLWAMSTRSSLAVFDVDSLVESNKWANVNSLPHVRRAMHGGRYHVFTQAMQDAQLYNAGAGVARRGPFVVLPTD